MNSTAGLDVVYICQAAERNEALRYSLRSLKNLSHRRVFLVGYQPRWTRGVGYVPTMQRGPKHANTWRNWCAMAACRDMTRRVVLFNDDFFVTKPAKELPVYHRGDLDQMIAWYARRRLGTYRTRATHTRSQLHTAGVDGPLLSYELHVPMIVDRALLAEAIGWLRRHSRSPLEFVAKRTFYGNFARIGGVKALDVKVQNPKAGLPKTPLPYLSTSPKSWSGLAGGWIRRTFAEPGPYEGGARPSPAYRPPAAKPKTRKVVSYGRR